MNNENDEVNLYEYIEENVSHYFTINNQSIFLILSIFHFHEFKK